jgi:protein transport protein SEC61 subunit gamma and related proteins
MANEEEDIFEEEVEAPRRAQPTGPPPKTFLERSWALQDRIERRWESIGRGRIARVLRMARKPESDEFRQSAFIVLVGIAVIGGIGFFIYLLMSALLRQITSV